MHTRKLVFSQLMDFLPWRRFDTCVRRYHGDRKIKSYPCSEHWRVMAFAQLTYRESLRDIETCLRAVGTKRYHMGIRNNVSRNNLSNANRTRDWRIYADFAQILIGQARAAYADEDLGIDLDATVYALDASTIDLCLSMFPWAKFRKAKGAVKIHALMSLQGNIPEFILISDGKLHDVNVLDILIVQPGSFYLMDRGYVDFARLYTIQQASAFFVTRCKRNFQFKRRYSHPVDKSTGLRCDQTIITTGVDTAKDYPIPLRRIRHYDTDTNKNLIFITNNFNLPALIIAMLYKARWQVELFFKWIKQHLRIKAFYGTSANAVKTQVWIAVSVYILVAILKKRLELDQSLYTILQFVSVSIFEKTPISEAFSQEFYKTKMGDYDNQLLLFNL
jgi:hypothetical protein